MHWKPYVSVLYACLLGYGAQTIAAPTFDVVFDDPNRSYSRYYDRLQEHFIAAGDSWGQYIDSTAAITISIRFDPGATRAGGRSYTVSFLRNDGPYAVWDQSAPYEIRTGVDPNADNPDIDVVFEPSYLTNELWFDPDPFQRVAVVPSTRTDAMSVALHELGHALGFIGWRDWTTGQLSDVFASPFDMLVEEVDTDFFFAGPAAVESYGGLVPLTFRNLFHLGNDGPRPGDDLVPDLMNGVVFNRGARYEISELDLAVLTDLGVPIYDVPAGDFNGDRVVDALDIDLLFANLGNDDLTFDLDQDNTVNNDDLATLVHDILRTDFGDANLDGSINDLDLDIWTTHRFSNGTWATADFDGDGTTDGRDFNIWSDHRTAAFGAVPEPGGTWLAIWFAGTFVVASTCRRGKR